MAAKTKKVRKTQNLVWDEEAGGGPRKAFLQEVAAVSTVDLATVKKGVRALTLVVTRHLREKKKCMLPNMARLEVKVTPAREASIQFLFGKQCQLQARREKKHIKVTVLKPLRDTQK